MKARERTTIMLPSPEFPKVLKKVSSEPNLKSERPKIKPNFSLLKNRPEEVSVISLHNFLSKHQQTTSTSDNYSPMISPPSPSSPRSPMNKKKVGWKSDLEEVSPEGDIPWKQPESNSSFYSFDYFLKIIFFQAIYFTKYETIKGEGSLSISYGIEKRRQSTIPEKTYLTERIPFSPEELSEEGSDYNDDNIIQIPFERIY